VKFVGIDAGSNRTGVALVESIDGRHTLSDLKLIRLDLTPFNKMPVSERLLHLFRVTVKVLNRMQPDYVVVEKIRVRNGGRNMDGYLASGRSMQTVSLAAGTLGIPVIEALAVQTRSVMHIASKKRDDAKAEGLRVINERYAARLPEIGFPGGLTQSDHDLSDAALMALAGEVFLARQTGPFSFTEVSRDKNRRCKVSVRRKRHRGTGSVG
jgi:Holliday junction resolvasome RuvABC endonuclease subunit